MNIRILGMRQPFPAGETGLVINVCSNAETDWQNDLSPFKLGPCLMENGLTALNMENAWQFAKVYAVHADADGKPTEAYWDWAMAGWNNPRAVRYPMGRGARPLYSLCGDERLGYVESRKRVYAPLYMKAVRETNEFKHLTELAQTNTLWLRDFDGYDHVAKGLSLTDVLNLSSRKMGHAFVLAMMLTNDEALKQITAAP